VATTSLTARVLGRFRQLLAVSDSSGVVDSGRVPLLGSAGKLDQGFLPFVWSEGSFTPGLSLVSGSTATPVSQAMFTSALGTYSRMGNRVTCELVLRLGATKPTGNSTDSLRVTGLPFAARSYASAPGTDMVYILAFQLNNGAASSGTFTTAGIPQGGDYVTCQKFASGAVSNLTLADINAGAVLRMSLMYVAA